MRKIKREQSQYDEYLKQYEFYEGKTLSQEDYQKAGQEIYEKLHLATYPVAIKYYKESGLDKHIKPELLQ